MSRIATVRKADLDRVLKALKDAGEHVARVEVTAGGVTILTGEQLKSQLSDLDRWRAERGHRATQGS